jgi:hypothetical protein
VDGALHLGQRGRLFADDAQQKQLEALRQQLEALNRERDKLSKQIEAIHQRRALLMEQNGEADALLKPSTGGAVQTAPGDTHR